MKKLISVLIVAVMICATFASAVSTSAVEGIPVAEVEALYFDVKPSIDGIVSEAEWGEPSAYVDQADVGNSKVIIETDTPEANDLNTFFYRNQVGGYDVDNLNMSYYLWFRWDENYLYVAAKVSDPDGHSLKNGKNETWNGDALQFRVDSEGYNASCVLGPELYDAEYDGKPWSREDVADFCLGFVQSAGGFSEAWRNSPGTSGIGLTSFSGGNAQISVAPAGANYSGDTASGITTYEFAVPWGYVDSYTHSYENYSDANQNGAIGREYGISAVVYNADGNKGAAAYNAGLAWGSGIINVQQEQYVQTCGGSNKVTLSGDKVSQDGSYSAGYEKGAGYTPPVVKPAYDLAIDESFHTKLDYEKESDMDILGYYRGGEWVTEDGNAKNHVARWDLDESTDSGFNEVNYLSTASEIQGELNYTPKNCSYTMEYDVKVTGLENFEDGYGSQLYHWFGGAGQVDYMCGYDFDKGKFIIQEYKTSKMLAELPGDFTLNEWHHVVFQYFRDNSEMRFYFDPKMENGRVAKDAVPMFQMSYRYFDMPAVEANEIILRRMNCQILLDNVEYYNFVDWTGTGKQTDEQNPDGNGGAQPISVDEEVDVTVGVEKRDDGTFAVSIPNEDKFKAANVTAVKFTVDLKKADGKLKFKALEDVTDGAVAVTDNGDGTVTLKVNDLKIFANVESGKDVMKVILEPVDADFTAEEVKNLISIKATVTSTSAQTGDNAVLYIASALVLAAIVAGGVVLYSKKRRQIEL